MPRRRTALFAGVVLTAVAWGLGPAAQAQAPPPVPKAWIVVDADSGAVIDAGNERTPLPPASVSKLLTALVAIDSLQPGTDVPVSARAEGMPARKMNLKAGQVWRLEDLVHALLIVSANDAAVALAERVSGSEAAFAEAMQRTAEHLGVEDDPVLKDASGLDDEFSHGGGNFISARDLAIVARAALTRPLIANAIVLPEYRFTGGDGHPHRLLNHNRLLKTYPGAIGMKTGSTRRAGRSLAAAATRNGRTMIAIVIGAVDTYASASLLLDRGFATPVSELASMDHLPEVPPPLAVGVDDAPEPATARVAAAPTLARPVSTEAEADDTVNTGLLITAAASVPLVGVVLLRRRAVIRRRRRRHARLISWS